MARIVVGVDASPGALLALSWAADEARLRLATLEVVHAYSGQALVAPLWLGTRIRWQQADLEPGVSSTAAGGLDAPTLPVSPWKCCTASFTEAHWRELV